MNDRLCTFEGCDRQAETLWEPYFCSEHIVNAEQWFDKSISDIEGNASTEDSMGLRKLFAHSSYMNIIESDPIANEFYDDFISKADTPKKIAFSNEHFVTLLAHFFIQSAASGVTGNFTYDAVKNCVMVIINRIRGSLTSQDDHFEDVVDCNVYERVRTRGSIHIKVPFFEFSRDFEREIESKYSHIVSQGTEKDPEILLYRPRRNNPSE